MVNQIVHPKVSDFTFVDLFAGIGGFHIAMQKIGGKCVFASEVDSNARKTYEHNFHSSSPELFENGLFNDDIRSVSPESLPDFDVLCAGFPCQPFSQAGYKRGFADMHDSERGNLFFNIADIIQAKQPRAYFLENVRGLVQHDKGNTFEIIRNTLERDLGYSFYYQIVKASDYGLPQLRPRVFIIGFRDDTLLGNFNFPPAVPLKFNMSDVWGGECSRDIGFTLRVGGRGSPITDRRNWDSYLVDGHVKKLMPEQGRKMQGFPETFEFPVSSVAAMKQLGNSVAVDAVYECGKSLVHYMNTLNTNSPMNNKANKGEWTELYTLLHLINSRFIQLADSKLDPKLDEGFNVSKVKTHNSPNEYILSNDDFLTVQNLKSGEKNLIKTSSFIDSETLKMLASRIKNGKGRSFEIKEFEIIKSKIGLFATKGGHSNQKADILADISNLTLKKREEGFGIKSYLGNKPTLLNASGANTNFIYKIEGIEEIDFEAINTISDGQKIKKRLAEIHKLGGSLRFIKVEADTMNHNLKMIDSNMCYIIAEMLKTFYVQRISLLKECVTHVHDNSPLNSMIQYGEIEHLEKTVKKLLLGIMFGFFTGKKWDGNYTANGAIIVKSDGSQVGYHITDQKSLEGYLFDNIKFDTPSTSRHRFASIIKEKDGYYFKLNLQLRF